MEKEKAEGLVVQAEMVVYGGEVTFALLLAELVHLGGDDDCGDFRILEEDLEHLEVVVGRLMPRVHERDDELGGPGLGDRRTLPRSIDP